jgi:phosphate transport system permease protein
MTTEYVDARTASSLDPLDNLEFETLLRDEALAGTEDDAPPTPRPMRSRTFDDQATLYGSIGSSLSLSWLIYEFILPFSGLIGFVVLWYTLFVVMYAALTSLSNGLTVVVDRVMATIVHGGAMVVGAALITAVGYPLVRGYPAWHHLNFFTSDMKGVGPNDPLSHGGVFMAIMGTLIEIGIAVAIALPLGVGTAIYMSEVGGRFSRVVRTVVEAMTALPSIVAGLFIYDILIVKAGIAPSGFPASLAISIMILPIIARASDVVLRVVPGGLREASLALGASHWSTVWRVVLPTVRPGLATALILGIARGVGETSPVLLTSGGAGITNLNPFNQQPMNSLPLFTYQAVRSGQTIYEERGFGAASVLIVLVLILFVIARLLARQRVK